jgi:hypothetical protein
VLRNSFALAFLAFLASLALTACVSDDDVETIDQPITSVENGVTYLSIRPDTRRCVAPLCGGHWVSAVNGGRLMCADGTRKSECYVATLDTEALALPESDELALKDRIHGRGSVIVGGTLGRRSVRGFGRLGHLEVTEAWTAGAAAGVPTGTAVLVNLNGVRCIQAPCPSLSEQTLNSDRSTNIADLDFRPSGATEDEVTTAWDALTAEGLPGLIVVGDRYTACNHFRDVTDARGVTRRVCVGPSAPARTVTQFYTRVVASEPTVLSVEECESAGAVVRGDIGDGNVACASGETELGRVRTGIEGGVCCERIVLTPDQCESAGGFIRTDIGDGKIACEAGETDLGRVAFGREGGVCCQ